VKAELQSFAPDVIHVTGPNDMGQLGAWLAHRLGIPLVVSWHTNLHDFAGRRLARLSASLPRGLGHVLTEAAQRYSLRLLQDFYRLGRVVLAPNPELVAMLSEATRTRVHLMERGVDTTLFSPDRRQASGREFRLGFVGRLSPEKNVRALVTIDDILRRRGLEGYRFVIVGDGSERPWLAAHLRHAEFCGVLSGSELADAYAGFDAFVFPSETDTYGNVVLEAMASGVPVIVTAAGGPRFLVRECVTGLVCRDAGEMASARSLAVARHRRAGRTI
jgi:glycosyltransferase involved in cell wall biosynthesis